MGITTIRVFLLSCVHFIRSLRWERRIYSEFVVIFVVVVLLFICLSDGFMVENF